MVSVKFPTDIDRLVDQDPLGSEPSVRMACHLRWLAVSWQNFNGKIHGSAIADRSRFALF